MEMEMDMEEKLVQEEEDLMATKRIFIGGLGEKVTEEDLHKTFSSLGTIKGIQFVRSNERSFAYLDFKPTSDKSLSKLFSSYNGCVWKGGRLRLEKAKEHYMVRLRREWEEDAELAHKDSDEVDANENKDVIEIKDETTKIPASIQFLNKSKLLNLEKKQLQLFFPKLKKVKSVPYSGTGKHKYSFQRVEVPSLPIHFCDCEEHCGSSNIPMKKQTSDFENQIGNVNDEELDMMRSVMNKIFKREGNSSTEISNVRVPTEEESPNQSMKDAPSNESEADQDSDADNLVINIVSGGNAKLSMMEKGILKSEPNPAKRLSSRAGSTENKFKAQKVKNNVSFNPLDPISKKMPGLLPSDESNRNEFTSTMPKKKENPETYILESRDSIVAQADKKSSSQQLATGHLWGQKSSWKKLVGETTNSSFSISDILPDVITKQNLSKSNGVEATHITGRKRKKLMRQEGYKSSNIEPLGSMNDESLQNNLSTDGPSINAPKLIKKVKPADYEPVGPITGKRLQDISTDGPSIIATNATQEKLMKQAVCKSANSEPLEFEKVEILQDEVGPDDPSINVQNSMIQGNSANSEPMGLTIEEILHDNVSANGQSTVAPSGFSSKESEYPEDIQPAGKLASGHQTVGGQSWIQKSSWRELVGGIGNNSFSISHILPDIVLRRQNLQNYNSVGIVNANDTKQTSTKQFTSELTGNGSHDAGNCVIAHDKVILTGSGMASPSNRQVSSSGLEGVTDKVKRNSENHKIDISESSKSSGSTNNAALNRKACMDIKIGEVCTFMKSDVSEREWKKTRATLSAALKKKSNEKL